jgi:hypothetical protein
MTFKRVAIAVLIIWVVRNVVVVTSQFQPPYLGARWVGAVVGYNLFDVRVWILVVGIALLAYREKRSPKKH